MTTTPRRPAPSTPSHPLGQRLNAPQLAFVRAWAEGLDLVTAWNRYLWVDGAGDARRARGELKRLLDQLGHLARAHGRPELAALLRRDPQALPEPGPVSSQDAGGAASGEAPSPALPTLEEFAAQQPADFYSQAELLAMYQAQFGRRQTGPSQADLAASEQASAHPSPATLGSQAQDLEKQRLRLQRRQRLRERLAEAIQWLQTVALEGAARAPLPGDPVAAWIDERQAARLAAVGIQTLGQLIVWIKLKGFNWHRGIPRVGPESAARIVRWLGEHADSLGALPSPSLVPLSQVDTALAAPLPRVGIVPLERFMPPSDRDGRLGSNRAPLAQCKVAASNDYEAIRAWLRLRVAGTHTWRAYRKEAERFLLWAVLERRKALSSLDGDDCVAYRDFLASPGSLWTGPRHAQRWSESWRPFEGALSVRSQATALTIVRTLCEWLVRRHYLDSNPWDDVPRRPDAPSMPQLRALSQKQWSMVQGWMEQALQRAPSPALQRLKFLMDFAYMSGMRLAELAAARLGWFRLEPLDDGPGEDMAWSIMVLGKRSKWREVPLPDPAMAALRSYLVQRGLDPDPLANDPDTPLICTLSGAGGLSGARIYEVLRAGFESCAADIAVHDARAAERIRQASTHWLRHTYGSHSAARGVPQDVLQANLGHESLATTSIYVRAEKARKHRAVQKAFGNG